MTHTSNLRKGATRVHASAATAMVLTAGLAGGAQAGTQEDHYPETPKLNPSLPIINTYHGSDHIKANVINSEPVCNPFEDYRTVVYKVKDNFTPAGTISATNKSEHTIPLTQELSRSETISFTVKGDRTNSTSVNLGGSKNGISASIAQELSSTVGAEFSYSLSWNVGQTIGPYDVPAGHTGEAKYGFRTIHMTGTQQYCKSNGTWSTPTFWSALNPVKNEVQVRLYDNPADSNK